MNPLGGTMAADGAAFNPYAPRPFGELRRAFAGRGDRVSRRRSSSSYGGGSPDGAAYGAGPAAPPAYGASPAAG